MRTNDSVFPEDLLLAFRQALSFVVLTGAGISAESGIPTFRDSPEGLWARYDPMELATPEAFARDPSLVARWYDWRREKCAAAKPNPGHRALARLEVWAGQQGRAFTLVTQNVDRLHHAAGSRRVVELHGTLWVWRCLGCGSETEERQVPFPEHPPHCSCGGAKRPGVVWFGESLPEAALEEAHRAAASCDLFCSLGTSAVVYPAAGLAHLARQRGGRILEINADPTPLSRTADWSLRGFTGELLPALLREGLDLELNNEPLS